MCAYRSTIPDSLIEDWFRIGKTVPKIVVSTYTATQRRAQQQQISNEEAQEKIRSEEFEQTSYANKFKDEEEREALSSVSQRHMFCNDDDLNEIEEVTTTSGCISNLNDLLTESSSRVYQNYDLNNKLDKSGSLPISAFKEHIVNKIECSRVTIIQGHTGSGKTTQVPQYILEKCMEDGIHCNIVVTQPRRIAAMSIARRVCSERGWQLGGLVGYQIGLDNKTSDDTRLTYMTTGVLLQKLITARNMIDFTHVILDEIHERDMESDLLMLVVRKLARTISKDTRVVLMSATVDIDIFAEYFSMPIGNILEPAQTVAVAGVFFDVYEYHLDSLQLIGTVPPYEMGEPKIHPQAYVLTVKLIAGFDTVESLKGHGASSLERGSVLVFLPGIEEINAMYKLLEEEKLRCKLQILPLHSSISWEEQSRVFKPPEAGYRKIILSTNIAESSITVPDIKYVVDFCLTKAQVCDPGSNYNYLSLEWASKANCIQRKGRAGRVDHGRVYRMVTKEFYESFSDYGMPEMKRCPLDKAVLHAKILDMGEPKAILALAMDPPDLYDIERTISMLLEVGALAAKFSERGIACADDGDLTYLGRILAKLPIEVHLGKLVILGHIFGCLRECIIIAAGLSQKSLFSRPFMDPLKAYQAKLDWARGSFSDCIAIYNAYELWSLHKKTKYFERPGGMTEKKWGARMYLQIRRLHEVNNLVTEIKRRLEDVNIHTSQKPECLDAERCLLLKIIIAGAFYPHYFTQSELDEVMIAREVCGCDPNSTVVLSGLPAGHGLLYTNAIEEMLSPCGENMSFSFENTKAYVCFNSSKAPTFPEESKFLPPQQMPKIPMEMYYAMKMRLAQIPLKLRLLSSQDATRQLQQLGISTRHGDGILSVFKTDEQASTSFKQSDPEDDDCPVRRSDVKLKQLRTHRINTVSHSSIQQVELPGLHQSIIEIFVSHIIDCANFWAYYSSPEHAESMERIRKMIEAHVNVSDKPISCPLTPGKLCLARYQDLNLEYYRARINSVSAGSQIEIFYIDYGNSEIVMKEDLRAIDEDKFPDLVSIPMQAFRCALSEIKPCPTKCNAGVWNKESYRMVLNKIDQKSVHGRVYSVIHGVVRLEVIYKDKKNKEHSLNEELKEEHLAECAEEDYLSKQNYEIRQKAQDDLTIEDVEKPQGLNLNQLLNFHDLKLMTQGGRTIMLHGPRSPLEMSFAKLSYRSFHSVRVEQDSVNSVALDYDPKDTHARLLVASDITMSAGGDKIVARATTLFPNIHGLLSLIVLMFSPKVELRTDRERRRYTGAICGLGYQPRTGYPLLEDHDMELIFDTQFTQEDVILINQVRIGINMMLGSKDETVDIDSKNIHKVQSKLKDQIFKLISRPRKSVVPKSYPYPGRWKMVNKTFSLNPELDNTEANVLHVLPLISGIALEELPVKEKSSPKETLTKAMAANLSNHVRHLHQMASRSKQERKVICQLCNFTFHTPCDLLVHLQTEAHKKLELTIFKLL